MTQAFLECSCPPGFVSSTGFHHGDCVLANPDANVTCDPASTHPNCCHEDHDHAAAANACPGGHQDAPCPEPPGQCKTWRGAVADAFHPLYEGGHPLLGGHAAGDPVPPCPGGHCHKQVSGCTVCRPLIITAPSGGLTSITTAR